MRRLAVVAALLTLLAFVPSAAFAQADRCFPETGQCMHGAIRAFWERNGGLPVFGFPLTGELRFDTGAVGQIFERHAIETHPENRAPYDVQLALVGQFVYLHRAGATDGVAGPGTPAAGCRWFAETQHNLCSPFAEAWRRYGLSLDRSARISEAESLALFGLPITEPYVETLNDGNQYTVQYFQRARFELHGNAVLFGLLGREFYDSISRDEGVAPAQPAAPQPTTAPVPTAPPALTATPATARAGCDPSYPTVCIPPPPPDLDCGDIPYRRFRVVYDVPRPDPHGFDRDHDGIGCES